VDPFFSETTVTGENYFKKIFSKILWQMSKKHTANEKTSVCVEIY
jgi:hypothetical protein